MSKVVYVVFAPHRLGGGTKVAFRHVEALTALGFDAAVRLVGGGAAPNWFEHSARIEDDKVPLAASDILVLPEDDAPGLHQFSTLPNRKLIFCQNPYYGGATLQQVGPDAAAYREYLACSHGVAGWISRYCDYDRITVIPGFADERLFQPAQKAAVIACIPRKRPVEVLAIRQMFSRLYTGATDWRWQALERVAEREVAGALGRAAVFLSLARLEGMAMTTVEAMASDCLVAGFTGIGSREYANATNGHWVDEDDCEACALALVRTCLMADQNGGAAALMRHAGRGTARQWSHAVFVQALEAFWRGELG